MVNADEHYHAAAVRFFLSTASLEPSELVQVSTISFAGLATVADTSLLAIYLCNVMVSRGVVVTVGLLVADGIDVYDITKQLDATMKLIYLSYCRPLVVLCPYSVILAHKI